MARLSFGLLLQLLNHLVDYVQQVFSRELTLFLKPPIQTLPNSMNLKLHLNLFLSFLNFQFLDQFQFFKTFQKLNLIQYSRSLTPGSLYFPNNPIGTLLIATTSKHSLVKTFNFFLHQQN